MPTKAAEGEPLIERYIKSLEDALSVLPQQQSEEIVGEVREHISDLRREGEQPRSVEDILRAVGKPEDIAASARQRFDLPEPRTSAKDIVALVLCVANPLLPFIAPLIALALIRKSAAWTPAARRGPLRLLLVAPTAFICLIFLRVSLGVVSSAAAGVAVVLFPVALLVALVCPVVAGIKLARRMSPRPPLRRILAVAGVAIVIGLPSYNVFLAGNSLGGSTAQVNPNVLPSSSHPGPAICNTVSDFEGIGLNTVHVTYSYCGDVSGHSITSFSQPTCSVDTVAAVGKTLLCLAYSDGGSTGGFNIRAEFGVTPWTLPVQRTVVLTGHQDVSSAGEGIG